MKIKNGLIFILISCILYRLFYIFYLEHGVILYDPDSVGYFGQIHHFRDLFDFYRTPVYRLVIQLFEFISKNHFVRNLFVFQQLVSLLSLIPFYYVAKKIVKNDILVIIASLSYGCWHYLIQQNININPESLCISGSTFLLYLFFKYLETPKKLTAFSIGIYSLILIMLKPTYLIVLAIIFLFFGLRFVLYKIEKKAVFWGGAGLFISIIGVLGYCSFNYYYNGNFILTKVTLNNAIANVVRSNAYKYGGDSEFITIVDSTKEIGYYRAMVYINNETIDYYDSLYQYFPKELKPTYRMIICSGISDIKNFSYSRINKFINKSKFTTLYLRYLVKRSWAIFYDYLEINLIILFQFIIALVAFVKLKKISFYTLISVVFVWGQFFTIIISGIEDIKRLLMPSYPFIIILIASLVGLLYQSIGKTKLLDSID